MSYNAICCRIANIYPHPNADRLKLAVVQNHQIVVGLDAHVGQLGVFFPEDGQLSQRFAEENDLIARTEDGQRKGGYFSKDRRVRAQRFRGEKSEGFFAPLEYFAFTGATPKEGDEFDTLNGMPICNKYVTPATLRARVKNGVARRANDYFREHVDTKDARRARIIPGMVWITEKLHGTSGRFGYVLDAEPRTWLDWLLGRTRKTYRHLIGTRRVVLKDREQQGFYGNEEFRWEAVKDLVGRLHKGEILYFELVGYTPTKPIMAPHEGQVYHYGQAPGTCGLYVYRITMTNEDNVVTELAWHQVKARCNELRIKFVPELAVSNYYDPDFVEAFVEGQSTLGAHIREGVVARIEGETTQFVKRKSFQFGVLEGYLKDNDNYVDTEEAMA